MSRFPSIVPDMFKPRTVSGPGANQFSDSPLLSAPNMPQFIGSGRRRAAVEDDPTVSPDVARTYSAPYSNVVQSVLNKGPASTSPHTTFTGDMDDPVESLKQFLPGSLDAWRAMRQKNRAAAVTRNQIASQQKTIAATQREADFARNAPMAGDEAPLSTDGTATINGEVRHFAPGMQDSFDVRKAARESFVKSKDAEAEAQRDFNPAFPGLAYPGAYADMQARQARSAAGVAQANAQTGLINAEADATKINADSGAVNAKDLAQRHTKLQTEFDQLQRENTALREKVGKANPTTKPSDVVSADREKRLSQQTWLQHYKAFKDDPEFMGMPIKEKIALAKEMAGLGGDDDGADNTPEPTNAPPQQQTQAPRAPQWEKPDETGYIDNAVAGSGHRQMKVENADGSSVPGALEAAGIHPRSSPASDFYNRAMNPSAPQQQAGAGQQEEYPEGSVAHNKQTGQTLIKRGGQWVAAPSTQPTIR